MSNQEQLMSQLNDLQATARNLFAGIELAKGKLPFEFAPECTQHKANWYNADEFAKFLGNGWRLPTRAEVPLLAGFLDVGVQYSGKCWTSETIGHEGYDDFEIWAVDSSTGEEEKCDVFERHIVLLVRDRSND